MSLLHTLKRNKVLILSGPTATGKTGLAIELACDLKQASNKTIEMEIVNFDSLLFYHELKIGTAAPSSEELALVPHHMVGIVSITTPLNAHDFVVRAQQVIEKLLCLGKVPVLVGGSGFYLRALLNGMYDSPSTLEHITKRSQQLYDSAGIHPFLEILQQVDSDYFKQVHSNDHYRVRRAVEHYWMHNTPFSALKRQQQLPTHGWELCHLGLDLPKDLHAEVIGARTLKMLERGLIEEVRQLLSSGFKGSERPLQSIGYKEVQAYLRGEILDQASLIEAIILSTKHLAKAQRTWFKKVKDQEMFSPHKERQQIFNRVYRFLEVK
ncbi:MAG: tRNA (adenosine(37)-N6)-dimethylallyltransferase MiaA [Oligoflexia bacterium]|nr:tRNA (adenosine(37)-N6)-dimethylallyltransferase MiaA [Oligoflexia bacterium]MBF0365359.1 tRNA (adenosine(37)-N6)-dimethylallyltransferase MiaA [Oligoflexia bacterium]